MDERGLIDWYRRSRHRGKGSSLTICQCATEEVISQCDNPSLMRAFLFVAVYIDEAMRTPHYVGEKVRTALGDQDYAEFRKHFGFPRIEAHGDPEEGVFESADWLIFEGYGWDKLMDWSLCAQVAETLLTSVQKWLREQAHPNDSGPEVSSQLGDLVSIIQRYRLAATTDR